MRAERRRAWSIAGSTLALVLGLALAVWLVRAAGFERVLTVIRQTGFLLPIATLLEVALATTDVMAIRVLLGRAVKLPNRTTWARATLLAYAASVLLPGGRAACEAARAATLSPAVGARTAASAAILLQACALVGNALASLVAFAVISDRMGVRQPIALAVALNGTVCGVLGAGLLGFSRSARVTTWLRARFNSFERRIGRTPEAVAPQSGSVPPRGVIARALAWCTFGRALQTAQYGVVLAAVGVATSPARASIAQGVHLVGAAAGDLVPNQMGATEGAYRVFARALSLENDPARALSIALVVRVVQLGLAVTCLFIGLVILRTKPAAERARDETDDV